MSTDPPMTKLLFLIDDLKYVLASAPHPHVTMLQFSTAAVLGV
jgi:hypothetical protein